VLYRRAVLIYNPAAGRRRERRRREVEQAAALIRSHAADVETLPTGEPHSATRLAREASRSGADLVLACGGDGTINEVLNGVAGTSVPLAVLPAGTANVLAIEAGLPLTILEAARCLPELEPRRISLGRVCCQGAASGGRYFLLMAGAGVDAHIVYHLNLRLKARLGLLAYFLAAAGELWRRKEPFEVEVQGERHICTFAVAAKAAEYGGRLRIARGAELLADRLEVVLFQSRSRLRYVVYLGAVYTGLLARLPDVRILRTAGLRFSCAGPAVYVQVDGEFAGRLPAAVDVVPDALSLLLPRGYTGFHG
jgi:diacylglycerol kinase (ATP)